MAGFFNQRVKYAILPVLLCYCNISFGESTYNSSTLGYSIRLPDGWAVKHDKSNKDIFFDKSGKHSSYLAVEVHARDTVDFPTCESWTRAHFDSYLITARYGINPWGAVIMYDSSSSVTLGDRWAPEIYARFFDADSVTVAWNEYIIYSCTATTGYEIYAIGDTTDMDTNLVFYGNILRSVRMSGAKNLRCRRPLLYYHAPKKSEFALFHVDCRGRMLHTIHRQIPKRVLGFSNGIMLEPGKRHLIISR